VTLAKGGARIGYLPGPGDEVPSCLRRVGYDGHAPRRRRPHAGGPRALRRRRHGRARLQHERAPARPRAPTWRSWPTSRRAARSSSSTTPTNRLAPLTEPLGPWPFAIGHDRGHRRDRRRDVLRGDPPRRSRRPTRSRRATSRAGFRSAASTSPRPGTRAIRRRCRCTIPTSTRSPAACSGRVTGRAPSSYTGLAFLPAAPRGRARRVPPVREPPRGRRRPPWPVTPRPSRRPPWPVDAPARAAARHGQWTPRPSRRPPLASDAPRVAAAGGAAAGNDRRAAVSRPGGASYLIVVGALALQVIIYAAITAAYRWT